MRLIDLDQIEYFTLVDKLGVPRYKIEIGEDIGIPTVDAIPVEWIENYISKIKDDGMIYLSSAGCIKDMLKDWEKENESV